jgi:hypothetical protein
MKYAIYWKSKTNKKYFGNGKPVFDERWKCEDACELANKRFPKLIHWVEDEKFYYDAELCNSHLQKCKFITTNIIMQIVPDTSFDGADKLLTKLEKCGIVDHHEWRTVK